VSDDGASSSALPSPQAAQSPEEAAEALRLLSEAQHGHQAVIESINGEAAGDDELDDDDEHELGVCNAQEVLEAYARCRERETLRTYRSAVTAFTNWLVTVKDNLEVKAMVAKILKHSGMPPTYKLDFKELAKSLEGPANMYCRGYSVVPESCKPQDEVRLGAHQESALWTF
tara:strand:- start:702 stop:1217 length:516 start_codon:yes stop_codon:yes gene_type:complete